MTWHHDIGVGAEQVAQVLPGRTVLMGLCPRLVLGLIDAPVQALLGVFAR